MKDTLEEITKRPRKWTCNEKTTAFLVIIFSILISLGVVKLLELATR